MRPTPSRLLAAGLALLAVGCTPGAPGEPAPSASESPQQPIDQIIGRPLRMDRDVLPEYAKEGITWGQVTFHDDGTVTGDKSLVFISNPTHWQRDGDILKLCTEQECEFWSEWKVRRKDAPENEIIFELVFANAKDDQGKEITRTLKVIQ
ncbi:MAG: hypothetical protein Q4D96_14260 [Propionibacteriaceae bacterium]|nr:hypothetical protein [Propionibacteriaceae bacterium]